MEVEDGEDRGVVIGHHEARAVESLGLVNEHVAASVVSIIGHYHTSWEGGEGEERRGEEEGGREGGGREEGGRGGEGRGG